MKQKDIALIVIVVFVSGVMSLLISGKIFGASSHNQQAETVQPISSNFQEPDKTYFNKDAIDPTKTITIEQNSNTDPFRGNTQ